MRQGLAARFPFEFVYQLFALLLAAIVVHAVYVGLIRPNARADLTAQAEQLAENPEFEPERSLWVMIKDPEQEFCLVLMLWAAAIMALKARNMMAERRLFEADLFHVSEGQSVLPEDTREYARVIEALPENDRERLLPRALLAALHRFRATRNVQDVSEAVTRVCEEQSDRLDSELAVVRYIAWAIPAIGFIGTVRGIGDALAQAHKAVEGDITGVTESLGVAFNSTLFALLLSIVLMFLLFQLQLAQERLVLDTHTHCDRRLVHNLQSSA
ncbi:MAG: MotA/TolQ/ExbB proton channel family protein [Panacagrimonas sp.]